MVDDYTPTTDEILDGYVTMRSREIPGDRVLASIQALSEAERWLAEHDAEKRAEWEAEQGEGRRRYAACWQDDNGVLSRIESWTAAREYAEADVKRWRAIESKEEGGQPDRVILATKIECPWLPVPDTGAES